MSLYLSKHLCLSGSYFPKTPLRLFSAPAPPGLFFENFILNHILKLASIQRSTIILLYAGFIKEPMSEVSRELKEKYDTQYSDATEEWRRIGAAGKAENIISLTEGLNFTRVIDIGAGDGNVLALLSENKFADDFTAIEISDSAIEQIKKKNIAGLSQIKQFDGYILPFRDKEFDLAICSHVIEHVEHPRTLLREIKRISKNQIFEVPIDFSINVDRKFAHFNAYGHINIYTPALFNFLLLSEGFELLKSKHSLYRKEAIAFETKGNTSKYLKTTLARLIWKSIPILMKIKPHSYTVLTK